MTKKRKLRIKHQVTPKTTGIIPMWNWLAEKILPPLVMNEEHKPKRARTKRGRYKGDDKSTADYNEAWVGGKAPKKWYKPW
jgi:DNA relaxase NicK